PRMLLDPVARPLLFDKEQWSVPVLLAAIGSVVLIGAMGLFLRDRSWTDMRDLSLAGIAVVLLRVLLG
ncbi:MAG TPA: hypothetical protein VK146_12835, partial [Tabrizicola sp.]|nr:hypothetical protein [Tabrizicola sp.]